MKKIAQETQDWNTIDGCGNAQKGGSLLIWLQDLLMPLRRMGTGKATKWTCGSVAMFASVGTWRPAPCTIVGAIATSRVATLERHARSRSPARLSHPRCAAKAMCAGARSAVMGRIMTKKVPTTITRSTGPTRRTMKRLLVRKSSRSARSRRRWRQERHHLLTPLSQSSLASLERPLYKIAWMYTAVASSLHTSRPVARAS
mmetsp:Transcript_4253/g.8722  ORF Transcript_4253/g.8722 Transcript_4253/m.8722 type:complete len:201 (+) Transcript_4253:453-1055(+)